MADSEPASVPDTFDAFRLSPYVRELGYQSEAAYFGLESLDAVSRKVGVADSTPRMFAALQSILVAAGTMTTVLWPETDPRLDPTAQAYAVRRGETLRSELSVRPGHPLSTAAVRRAVIGIDRRLDALTLAELPIRDRTVSLPGNAWHEDPDLPRHQRTIDPISGLATVLTSDEKGREQAATINYRKLVQSIMRIGRDASAWLAEWRKRQYLNSPLR